MSCEIHGEQPPGNSARSFDWLLSGCGLSIVAAYIVHWQLSVLVSQVPWLHKLAHSVFELVNTMWWGVVIGILMIAVLGRVPREFVMSALGTNSGHGSIVRATFAGILLDLCSHGILMVGAKLYERGASTGQVIAFLVSSPWNSFSLTFVLIALIGVPWTLGFIVLSMVIAVVTGILFDRLVGLGVLPANPQRSDLPVDFRFWAEAKRRANSLKLTGPYIVDMLLDGIKDSRMVLRWIFFGVLLASLVRALVPPEHFATFFGPTLMGLAVTIVAATVLEVCSEGSTPIAADILNRAGAPGNSFAFLMGGVATDYTEIMVLQETTRSWKVALFLPLITLPQVIVLGWLINLLSQ
ncbi:MAG: permease [Pseudomonadales bacterium]